MKKDKRKDKLTEIEKIMKAFTEWDKNPKWTDTEMDFASDFKADPYEKHPRAGAFYAGYKAGQKEKECN